MAFFPLKIAALLAAAAPEVARRAAREGARSAMVISKFYRLFCRVVVTMTSVSNREIQVFGTDHRQDFYYGTIAPVNLPYNPLDHTDVNICR
jgi:hypothetical protein